MVIENTISTDGKLGWKYIFLEARADNIGEAFASQYEQEFNSAVEAGDFNNTVVGRRAFVNRKIKSFINEIETAHEYKKALAAVTVPQLPDGEQ
jgi:hypothetical protein